MKPRILVIDDELSICVTLVMALEPQYEAVYTMDANEGLRLLRQQSFHLVFLDLRIGEQDGLEVLRQIKELDDRIAIIMITAYGSIDSSVEAMKRGAFTYLSKPLHIDEMLLRAEQALSIRSLNERILYLSDELQTHHQAYGMIGKSQGMQKVYALIEKVKDVDIGITLIGESGTGKELVARAIHFSGNRREKRFIPVNCAAIPEGLLEEELFGHKKGAFTGAITDKIGKFQAADGGTIFLDEIGDMPLVMQSKVLRVLQEKAVTPIGSNETQEIDVRVIAATNRDLRQMMQEGSFRLDLFYRIHVVGISLPPLRERRQDIPLLCRHFIDIFNQEHRRRVKGLTRGAERLLMEYDFPGNIRELSNALEYGVVVCEGEYIDSDDLLLPLKRGGQIQKSEPGEGRAGLFSGMTLKEMEREVIRERLQENNGHQRKTAEQLGISVKGLRNKIRALGIKWKEGK